MSWEQLDRQVGGRLVRVRSPLAICVEVPDSTACAEVFRRLKNPYDLGEEVGFDADAGLGRRMDLAAERLCGGRCERWSPDGVTRLAAITAR